MSASHEDAVGTAALAKAALRLLAERRLVPTPENYEQAWRRVSGDLRPAADHDHAAGAASRGGTHAAHAAHRGAAAQGGDGRADPCAGDGVELAVMTRPGPMPAAAASREFDGAASHGGAKGANSAPLWLVEGLVSQLLDLRLVRAEEAAEARRVIARADWMLAGQLLHSALASHASTHWGPLIGQLQAACSQTHRGWTAARKREAINRVIDGAGKRDDMLFSRLHALIESWHNEPLVESADASACAHGHAADPDPSAAGPLVSPELWRQQRDGRLINEMSALLGTLCDNLAGMTEQTSWVRGQIDVLRDSLAHPDDYRRLSEIRRTIAENAESQRRLQASRRTSIDEVKQMISSWIGSVGELSRSTGAFSDRIDGYVESINGVDSIDELGDTVRAMLADTQAMSREIQSSHDEMAVMRSRAISLESEVSRLEEELANASAQMITDHLTKTMNRRGLEQAFSGAQSRAAEFQSPLALAVLDVDDFKRVNDTLGHKGGDDALQQLARIFKLKLRASDGVARFGGEEFVLLLPDLSLDDAVAHLVRLQREVTSHVFMSDQNRMFITFSAGVTMVARADTLTGAVERADQAMYAAKKAGKNCVRAV